MVLECAEVGKFKALGRCLLAHRLNVKPAKSSVVCPCEIPHGLAAGFSFNNTCIKLPMENAFLL